MNDESNHEAQALAALTDRSAAVGGLMDAADRGLTSGRWTAGQVLTHLDRWQWVAIRDIRAKAAGESSPESVSDWEVANDNWGEEDEGVPTEEARRRFRRSGAILEGLVAENADMPWVTRIGEIVGHPSEHLSDLAGAGS